MCSIVHRGLSCCVVKDELLISIAAQQCETLEARLRADPQLTSHNAAASVSCSCSCCQDLRNMQNMNEYTVAKHGTDILNAIKVGPLSVCFRLPPHLSDRNPLSPARH